MRYFYVKDGVLTEYLPHNKHYVVLKQFFKRMTNRVSLIRA